jgi:alpha-glucosidase
MHDGQNLFDNRLSTFGEWGVDESMNAIEKKYGYSAIVVGIEHGEKSRIDEYSPYHHPKHGGGEGKRYLDFVVNTLKPYIDKNYRTIPDRKHTAIGGSSMGGLISFCAGIYYPETFGKLLVFSPSFWFSDEVYQEAQQLLKHQDMRIYMLVGREEVSMMVHGVEKVEAILRKDPRYGTQGNLLVKYVKDGHHNETFWRDHYGRAFSWLFSLEQ